MLLIWTNTNQWGGVALLAMRFATYLRDRGVPFMIVEPEGSRLRAELDWAEHITAEEARLRASEVDALFLPSVSTIRDSSIPWTELAHATFFAWIVQPLDPLASFVPTASTLVNRFGARAIKPLLGFWCRHAGLVSALFEKLVRDDAVAVMDETAARSLPFYYPNVPKPSLAVPIPSPIWSAEWAAPARPRNPLVIGYLGRIDAVKFSAVGSFVEHQLALIARERNVELIAVAEGTHIGALEDACARAGIILRVTGYLPNVEARRLIRAETDFAVAMGTSALDIAAMGQPCIILDTSLRPGAPPQMLFRFVHETTGYNLGEYRDFPMYVGGLRPLPEIIALVERGDPGREGAAYVAREHDPQRCFALLLDNIRSSRATVGDIGQIAIGIAHSIEAKHSWYDQLRRQWQRLSGRMRSDYRFPS